MTQQQIRFSNHLGEKLTGTLHLPDTPTAAGVVLGHCFTCSRHTGILRQLGQMLADMGYMALRFDFSGNGQSEGVFFDSSYSKHIREVEAAVQYLAAKGVTWFALAGHSMGAAIAVLAGAQLEPVRAVCALAGRLGGLKPHNFLSQLQQSELIETGSVSFNSRGRALKLPQQFFTDAAAYDLYQTVAAYPRPLMIVHGDADEIIPVSEAHKAYRANPDGIELMIVDGGDHMFGKPDHRSHITAGVVDWIEGQQRTDAQRQPSDP